MAEYTFARRLCIARAYAGKSQRAVAQLAGLSNVQLSKLERGVTRDVQGRTLRKLCEALGVSPQYLLGMTEVYDAPPAPAHAARPDGQS